MNTLIVLLVSILGYVNNDLISIRAAFQKADESKTKTEELYNSLKDYDKKDPVILVYKGAAYTLQAQFESNRQLKKKLFTQGAKTIESAVLSAPHNMEIRLVRFVIQENSPKIVKYKGNLTEDKKLILDNFAKQTSDVKSVIRGYAKRSKLLAASELKD